ncbi:MAG: hypothetical protein NZ960_08135 [Candidatus Kapabacteria bacterium]|nr:hypothetical protein [Candidatus Kapabacteria bacterium]MDW8012851.1 hypothetical protein [Bacteroidota bacterium]
MLLVGVEHCWGVATALDRLGGQDVRAIDLGGAGPDVAYRLSLSSWCLQTVGTGATGEAHDVGATPEGVVVFSNAEEVARCEDQ